MFGIRFVTAVVIVLVFLTSTAAGQPPVPISPAQRPVFSPYLNLVRRDAPPGINYFGIVRPQLAAQSSLLMLQQQLAAGQQQLQMMGQSAANPDLPVTGQQTFFLNTGGYFLNNRAGMGPVNQSFNTRSTRSNPVQPTTPAIRRR